VVAALDVLIILMFLVSSSSYWALGVSGATFIKMCYAWDSLSRRNVRCTERLFRDLADHRFVRALYSRSGWADFAAKRLEFTLCSDQYT